LATYREAPKNSRPDLNLMPNLPKGNVKVRTKPNFGQTLGPTNGS